MTDQGKIEIPLNKAKLLILLGGAVLFVVLGVWLLTVVAGRETGASLKYNFTELEYLLLEAYEKYKA